MDAFLFEALGTRIVVLVERDRPQDLESESLSPAVVRGTIKVEAFFAPDLGLRVRALVDGEVAGPCQRPAAQGRGNRLFGSQSSLQQSTALGKAPPRSPIEPEARSDPQRRLRILMRKARFECGAKVCDLDVDEVEPMQLLGSVQLAVGLLGQHQEASAMPCLELLVLPCASGPLQGVLANGLEQPVARCGLVVDDQ